MIKITIKDMNSRDKSLVKITAILGIVALEVTNLLTASINGALFGLVVAGVAGLAGYELAKR